MFENVKAVLVRSLDRDDKLGTAQSALQEALRESLGNITEIGRACPFAITKPVWHMMDPIKAGIVQFFDCLRYPEYNDQEFMEMFKGDIDGLIDAARVEIMFVEFAAELAREISVENRGLPQANEAMEYAQKEGLLSALRAKFAKKNALADKVKQADGKAAQSSDDGLGVMPDSSG
nr:hypothetical protein [Candidatus Sigynarchaeota archaeon]